MAGMDLGKQLGPLPLGAWVAVVVGGLGIAFYTRKSGTAPTVVTDTAGDAGVGTGGGMFIPINPPTDTPAVPAITTNEDWGKAAVNYLISMGYDPNVADTAVRKYLESTQLTLQEYALMRYALVRLGAPPIPLPAPPDPPQTPVVTPLPPPVVPAQPPPASAQLRFYYVAPGDSLSKIALRWYGNAGSWTDIYNANRKGYTRPDGSPGFISNPNYLRPGDKLWLPGTGGPVR